MTDQRKGRRREWNKGKGNKGRSHKGKERGTERTIKDKDIEQPSSTLLMGSLPKWFPLKLFDFVMCCSFWQAWGDGELRRVCVCVYGMSGGVEGWKCAGGKV